MDILKDEIRKQPYKYQRHDSFSYRTKFFEVWHIVPEQNGAELLANSNTDEMKMYGEQ